MIKSNFLKDSQKGFNLEQKVFQPILNVISRLMLEDHHIEISVIFAQAEKIYQLSKNTNEASVIKNWLEKLKEISHEDWHLYQNIIVVVENIEKKICFEMNLNDTLLSLKERIKDHFGVPVELQELNFGQIELEENERILKSWGLTDYSNVRLYIKPMGEDDQEQKIRNESSIVSNDSYRYMFKPGDSALVAQLRE